ncbi:MAG: protocatechuate 3,4-dioxygenase [Planctomycetota bacterium]
MPPMPARLFRLTRRQAFRSLAMGTAAFTTSGAFAEALLKTPRQTEGPFYPNKLPLDTDNDLLIINEGVTPALGKITHLGGRILSAAGEPIRNAVVEIWQVDHRGVYLHTDSPGQSQRDKNFQGYGRFMTGGNGEYYFRTIKPTPYPGRTPHIHVAVSRNGRRVLTTQFYIKGEPLNARDFLYNGISEKKARESVTIEFKPLKSSAIGELVAQCDVVLGRTPEDDPRAEARGLGPRRGTNRPAATER